MRLIPRHYLALLSNRDFFLLVSIIFIGQLATSFLMLSLVVSVVAKTGSNFGVSGGVLSFAVQGFFLTAAGLSVLLPSLLAQKSRDHSIAKTLADIGRAFIYIFNQKIVWFFFLVFAFMQGIVAFGVTLALGFFDEVVGLSINKSPIFVMPLIGLGVLFGLIFVHSVKAKEGRLVTYGTGSMGFSTLILGLILRFDLVVERLLLLPVAFFLVLLGFGVIVSVIASRTVLQKKVAHNFQGTVFGANILLASFLAGVMSPSAAGIEALLGYVNVLVLAGLGFLTLSALSSQLSNSWKF